MAKMTLLEMTQNILSALDSDEVNSINDTVESQQVIEVIKETYYEQFNNLSIPELIGIIKLDSVSDVNRPNYLRYPTNVKNIEWLRYMTDAGKYKELMYMNPEDFWRMQLELSSTSPNTQLITDTSGITYYITNNKAPSYYTALEDNLLVFDSYESAMDTTLQSSNSFAWGTKESTWTADDSFVPALDSNLFPLLLSEAKSVCFINFKQLSSAKEEQRARRQRIRMQKDYHKSTAAEKRSGDRINYARQR
jgi:hypothetical protein